MQSNNEIIFSVSEFIEILNNGLKKSRAKIIGEVSEISFGPTGHVYFYLKDEKDQSILKCMMYKNKYDIYGIEIKEGLKIIAEGYPNLHRFYSFAFIAEVIEYSGEGILKKEYEKLKNKLTQEGLFAEERKRPIPAYIQKIGVITSLKGAVIADFSNNLGRFGFKVKIIDSRVEGQAAVADLLMSIKTFKKQDIEALVIMRGGGSFESMLAFNNELLVREVVNFPVPVIAAIGHHKDVSLMALAADLAVSTPSIAATTLAESWKQATLFLAGHERNILGSYKEYLNNIKINLINSVKKSFSGFKSLLSRVNQQIKQAEKAVNLNNPERQLMLGFSIARFNSKIIRAVKNIRIGDNIDIQVFDGKINSEVKNICPKKNQTSKI